MRGVVSVVAGAVLRGIAAVVSKMGAVAIGPWAAVFVRSLTFVTVVGGYILYRNRTYFDGAGTAVYATLAGVTMGAGVVSVRFAYSFYEVSRVVPIQRLSVVITALLVMTLLEESVTARKVTGVALVVVAFLLLSP